MRRHQRVLTGSVLTIQRWSWRPDHRQALIKELPSITISCGNVATRYRGKNKRRQAFSRTVDASERYVERIVRRNWRICQRSASSPSITWCRSIGVSFKLPDTHITSNPGSLLAVSAPRQVPAFFLARCFRGVVGAHIDTRLRRTRGHGDNRPSGAIAAKLLPVRETG